LLVARSARPSRVSHRVATATTTVDDARGNTTHLIEYHAGAAADYLNDPAADYDDTRYTYTPAQQLASLTNPAVKGPELFGQAIH
jgi:hypothetical protein